MVERREEVAVWRCLTVDAQRAWRACHLAIRNHAPVEPREGARPSSVLPERDERPARAQRSTAGKARGVARVAQRSLRLRIQRRVDDKPCRELGEANPWHRSIFVPTTTDSAIQPSRSNVALRDFDAACGEGDVAVG